MSRSGGRHCVNVEESIATPAVSPFWGEGGVVFLVGWCSVGAVTAACWVCTPAAQVAGVIFGARLDNNGPLFHFVCTRCCGQCNRWPGPVRWPEPNVSFQRTRIAVYLRATICSTISYYCNLISHVPSRPCPPGRCRAGGPEALVSRNQCSSRGT